MGKWTAIDGTDEPITCGKKSIALFNIERESKMKQASTLVIMGAYSPETTLRLKTL